MKNELAQQLIARDCNGKIWFLIEAGLESNSLDCEDSGGQIGDLTRLVLRDRLLRDVRLEERKAADFRVGSKRFGEERFQKMILGEL